jgi:transforming growth factor-beta-induced protein
MYRSLAIAITLSGALALGACSEDTLEPMGPEMSQSAEAPKGKPDFAGPKNDQPSIATIASDAGFTSLIDALVYVDAEEGTELVKLFSEGTDQFTVFAPTNEAFGNLLSFLNDELGFSFGALTDIPAGIVLDVLLYHVVEGRRGSNSVVPANGERTMTSLLGEDFFVQTDLSIKDGLSGLRDAAAIVPGLFDLSAKNGIVHVISQVIVPPSVVDALTTG